MDRQSYCTPVAHAEYDQANSSRCRRRKWVGLRFLHTVLHRPPYRFRSIDCALEAMPGAGYCVTRTAFVVRMMAGYQFDCRLKMDAHLRSLYGCFEGADSDAVDYRDILCCMTFLRRYKEARENPSKLFKDLVLAYADDRETGTLVRRRDVLRVCRMGAVDEIEVWQTSSRLDRYLAEEAHTKGLKRTFRDVPLALLAEVMESNPSVMAAFRKQLWQRLPDSWRLGVLAGAEELGMEKATSGALTMKQRRAARWYAKTLSRRTVAGWKIFTNKSKLIRVQRGIIEKIRRRNAIHTWHAHVAGTAKHRNQCLIARAKGRVAVLRRYFNRFVRFFVASKKLEEMAWTFSERGKLVIAGVGLLRGVLRKRSMRLALQAWCEAASLMNAWEFAVDLSAERLCRRMFNAYRDIVKDYVMQRQLEDEADRRAAEVAEAIEVCARKLACGDARSIRPVLLYHSPKRHCGHGVDNIMRKKARARIPLSDKQVVRRYSEGHGTVEQVNRCTGEGKQRECEQRTKDGGGKRAVTTATSQTRRTRQK